MFKPKKVNFEPQEKKNVDLGDKIPQKIIIVYGKNPLQIKELSEIVKQKILIKLKAGAKKCTKSPVYTIREYDNDIKKFCKSFFNQETIPKETKDDNIVGHFIDLISKYITVEFYRKTQNKEFCCYFCHKELENNSVEESEGYLICIQCNTVNILSCTNVMQKDTTRVPEYILTYKKFIDKFRVINFYVPDEIYNKLDEYFKLENEDMLPDKVSKNPVVNGKRQGTNKESMRMALNKVAPEYTDDINEVLCFYWGWEIPDLDGYIDKIIEIDHKLHKYWNEVKVSYERKACLNSWFRFYSQVKALKIECDDDFFDKQESGNSLRLHKEVWSKFCKNNGYFNVYD